jgi:hypothetical protein
MRLSIVPPIHGSIVAQLLVGLPNSHLGQKSKLVICISFPHVVCVADFAKRYLHSARPSKIPVTAFRYQDLLVSGVSIYRNQHPDIRGISEVENSSWGADYSTQLVITSSYPLLTHA